MGRRTEERYCVNCGVVLQDRYKGRERKYCNQYCRKIYTSNKNNIISEDNR